MSMSSSIALIGRKLIILWTEMVNFQISSNRRKSLPFFWNQFCDQTKLEHHWWKNQSSRSTSLCGISKSSISQIWRCVRLHHRVIPDAITSLLKVSRTRVTVRCRTVPARPVIMWYPPLRIKLPDGMWKLSRSDRESWR